MISEEFQESGRKGLNTRFVSRKDCNKTDISKAMTREKSGQAMVKTVGSHQG
jgi:hypothetical protein